MGMVPKSDICDMERFDHTFSSSRGGQPAVLSKPGVSMGDIFIGRIDDGELDLVLRLIDAAGEAGRESPKPLRFDSRRGESGRGRSPVPERPSPIQCPHDAPVSVGFGAPAGLPEPLSHPAGATKVVRVMLLLARASLFATGHRLGNPEWELTSCGVLVRALCY